MCPPLQVSLAGASLSQLCAAISTTQDTHTPSALPWGFLQGPTVHGLVPVARGKLPHLGHCCLRPGHHHPPWDDFL